EPCGRLVEPVQEASQHGCASPLRPGARLWRLWHALGRDPGAQGGGGGSRQILRAGARYTPADAPRLSFAEPKTKSNRRQIALTPTTVAALRAHRARSRSGSPLALRGLSMARCSRARTESRWTGFTCCVLSSTDGSSPQQPCPRFAVMIYATPRRHCS